MEVYEQYKHVIDKGKIFLQHVYDEIDEVATVIADQRLSAYCSFIKSTIDIVTTDLDAIFSKSVDKPLAPEEIRQLCIEVFKRTEDESVGFSSTLRYRLCVLYRLF